jgi:hypothetical protein
MTAAVSNWLQELTLAHRREKSYRKDAARIVSLYEGQKRDESPFNILYSNTQTLAPALYNSPPRPVVRPRSKKSTPTLSAGSRLVSSVLDYLLDDGLGGSPAFDDLMTSAVLESLVVGRGVTRFKYEAKITSGPELPDADVPEPEESLESEEICGEEVPWDRFLHGYAKKWDNVPWVAFLHYMDTAELEEHFPGKIVPLSPTEGEPDRDQTHQEERADVQTAPVYEIWDKATKTVLFVSPNFPDDFLRDAVADPFGLTGFFPCPAPLAFFQKISTLTPVPLYQFYESQAKELNLVTTRIDRLVRALKIRGFYDATISSMEKLMESGDNTLLPADNVAALIANGQTLEKAIWFFPIEKLVAVLQQLYLQRNQIKQVIYEITGIADIMRGSSAASETLGAQQIKNQWGTLRLKRAQKEVSRYARDCLRILTELSFGKLSVERLQEMAGTSYPSQAEVDQASAVAQALQSASQPVPPELAAVVSQPSLESLVDPFRIAAVQHLRISIETNSTVDAEATEDKQNISELLNALAQFLNGVQPLVDAGALPFDAAKGMMLAIIKRFRFGPELEEELQKMQSPQPKPDPAAEKAKLDAEAKKDEMAMKSEMAKLDLQHKQALMQLEMQKQQMDLEFARQEHQFRMMSAQQKMQLDSQGLQIKREAQAVAAMAPKSGGNTAM